MGVGLCAPQSWEAARPRAPETLRETHPGANANGNCPIEAVPGNRPAGRTFGKNVNSIDFANKSDGSKQYPG